MKVKLTMPLFGLLAAALCGILCLSSCDTPVGLGSKVNMVPPTVTIDNPDFMENVGSDSKPLVIEGTAADKDEIVLLTITVEHIINDEDVKEWKQEFRSERGVWSSRSTASPVWEDTGDNGVWTSSNKKGNIHWSVEADIQDAPDGEYLISVSVENSVHKTSAVQQRRVVKDADPPTVTILAPELEDSNYEEIFDAYTTWKDTSILDRLHSEEIAVQYEVKDDFSLADLYFQLADDEGNIYYNHDAKTVENMGWSGKVTIPGAEIKDADGKSITGKKYLQLISTVTDKAENESRSHGWLIWWPDAAKPWVDGFGSKTEANVQTQSRVYPGSVIQGQAYDNKSVYSVSYKIYIIDDLGNEQPVDKNEGGEGEVINRPLEEGTRPSAFFNWTITSPKKCAVYKIVIDCWDAVEDEDADGNKVIVKGLKGESEERYFYVYDIDAPSIDLTKPTAQETLFGDKDGTFTVEGIVGDGVEPKRLTLVWLNPNADYEIRISYQSAEYAGWNKPGENDDKWEDDEGNLIWDLKLEPLGKNNDGRVEKKFSESLNLFTDLHIGMEDDDFPLTAQSFILRVEGDSGRAITSLHSVRGDIQPPSLSIDRIIVKRGDEEVQNHTTDELENDIMDILIEGDEIYLFGKWNDDSVAIWKDADKMGLFEVLWNNMEVPDAQLEYDGANSTWEAGPLIYRRGQTEQGSGHIKVSLQDLGANVTESSFSARINTNKPYLMFVSSNVSNGAYKAGDMIDIYLEFNKEVEYTGTDIPYLTLNNGKTAEHDKLSSNGTMRHTFTYTVADGDDKPLLNVIGIEFDSGTWTGGGDADMVIPSGDNLGDNKSIQIDTQPPDISKVESLTGAGSYKAGRTIYLRLSFDEDIVFTPGNGGAQLDLDFGGKTAVLDQGVSGQNSLLFTYQAADGDNTSGLSVTALALNDGASITDAAGNELPADSFVIPNGKNIADGTEGKIIIIDTTKPAAPVLNATEGSFNAAQTFTVSGETGAVLEYSVSTAGPWLSYPSLGGVTLSSPGTYTISARQTDLAGNISESSPEVTITIETRTPLLSSFGGSTPGTYGPGKEIEITLNLREVVKVTGSPQLTLQFNGDRTGTALFDADSSDTSTLTFHYTVVVGDDVGTLEIKHIDINGAKLETVNGGVDVTNELPLDGTDNNGNKLSFYTHITISTDVPEFVGAGLVENTLTLNFSKKIFKGNGSITLTQQEGTYLAPAVLTKDEYNRFGGAAVLGAYYTVGTNGTDQDGNADLTEKYILNYAYNTDGTDDNDNVKKVTDVLKERNADKVIIPVVSSAVTIAGTNNDALVIELSGSYAFNVKGADYILTFDAGLVRDEQNNAVAEKDDTSTTVKPSGVNKPFIRVQKESGRIDEVSVTAVQPRNAEFKIDCQTPGVTITYRKTEASTLPVSNFASPPGKPTVDMPQTADIDYTPNTPNTLLSDSDNMNGYLCGIMAMAAKDAESETAYEVAARSVIQFGTPPPLPLPPAGAGKTTQLWLRGGDGRNGENLTPGFPLSWDEKDSSGIQLMTQDGNVWYWISWEVNTTAYFHFIAGTTTTAEEAANGPWDWAWSKDTWSFFQDKYPLNPGGSIRLTQTAHGMTGLPAGTYAFPAFSGHR